MSSFYHFACSSQGFNHIKVNKICQDASGTRTFDDVAIIAVADGHGSDNYIRTDRGSKFAVSAALDAIQSFLLDARQNGIHFMDNAEDYLLHICKNILARWYTLVEHDVLQNPFCPTEMVKVSEKYKARYSSGRYNAKAYGTTLIAICKTNDFWFGLQIGDGKCIEILPDGNVCEPIPWDKQCEQNITTSICDEDALDEFRFACNATLPAAIFIGSDGIDDSYTSDEELHELYRSILLIQSEYGGNVAAREVQEYLPKISRKGSGDDVSIAGLINCDLSKEQLEVIRLHGKIIKAQSRLEQAQREHQSALEKKNYIESNLKRNRSEYQSLSEKMTRAEDDLRSAETALYQANAEWKQIQAQIEVHSADSSQKKAEAEFPDSLPAPAATIESGASDVPQSSVQSVPTETPPSQSDSLSHFQQEGWRSVDYDAPYQNNMREPRDNSVGK